MTLPSTAALEMELPPGETLSCSLGLLHHSSGHNIDCPHSVECLLCILQMGFHAQPQIGKQLHLFAQRGFLDNSSYSR